jgi:hypothetical protein
VKFGKGRGDGLSSVSTSCSIGAVISVLRVGDASQEILINRLVGDHPDPVLEKSLKKVEKARPCKDQHEDKD